MPTATTPLTGSWTIDATHSSAQFSVIHMGLSPFVSTFTPLSGGIESTEDGPRLTGSVAVDSVDVDQPDFKSHLLSEDFFDAANAPTIDFAGDLEIDGDSARLVGELSFRGQSHEVTATGRFAGPFPSERGSRAGLSLTAIIDRRDWGLDWNVSLPGGREMVANEVTLTVNLELDEAAE